MATPDSIRGTREQGIYAGFRAITYSSASGLDTGTSDMHQPGQRQACLVHVLRVFACSYIRPRM